MCRILCAVIAVAGTSDITAAEPQLPDLFAWESQQLDYMHGGFFDRNTIPNKVLYRFTGALPNQGARPLEVREVTHPNGTQDVYQRIHDDEGGVAESLIGSFPNANPTTTRSMRPTMSSGGKHTASRSRSAPAPTATETA